MIFFNFGDVKNRFFGERTTFTDASWLFDQERLLFCSVNFVCTRARHVANPRRILEFLPRSEDQQLVSLIIEFANHDHMLPLL